MIDCIYRNEDIIDNFIEEEQKFKSLKEEMEKMRKR